MADDWFFVYVHPHTAEILGWKHALGGYGFAHNPIDWLLWFHYSLHAGKVGEVIVAAMSLVLLGSGVTGVWIYRRQFWRGVFLRVRFRESSPRKRWANVHGSRAVGHCCSISSRCNRLLDDAATSGPAEHLLAPKPAAEVHAPTPGAAAELLCRDCWLAAEFPDFLPVGHQRHLNAPDDYRIYGRLRTEPFDLRPSSSEITIDGTTAAQNESFIRSRSSHRQLSAATIPLHFGNFGGWPVKVLWCLGGLAPGVLAISGILVWRARRRSADPPSRKPQPQSNLVHV
jgi:uncharacterized iron-regulated membrane protein